MPTDEQLYSRYMNGEVDALDELLVRHQEGLTWFLFGIVNNKDDALDLMMDTFALLVSQKVKFNNISSFKTWLYGIGRNLGLKHLRKNNRNIPVSNLQDDNKNILFDELAAVCEDDEMLSNVVKREEYDALYEALNDLREEYKTVLYLKYFVELDIEQIAKAMKKSTKQIYNLLARAKEQLKEKL